MEEETDFSKAKRALMSGEGADQKKKKASHAPKVDSNVPSSASYLVMPCTLCACDVVCVCVCVCVCVWCRWWGSMTAC